MADSEGVSLHVLGLYVNGVFDRFPKLQIVIGHMGEHLPYQLWRFDHRMSFYVDELRPKPKRTLRKTMKTVMFPSQMLGRAVDVNKKTAQNISITTSGHYGTPALLFAIEELGIDRYETQLKGRVCHI